MLEFWFKSLVRGGFGVTTLDNYITSMKERFSRHYDVYSHEKLGTFPLAFYAHYHRRDEKYFITKSIKVWGANNQQFVYVLKKDKPLTKNDVYDFAKEIENRIKENVQKDEEHMSSIFLGVIVTDQPVSREVQKVVEKYRKLLFFKWGMQGWAEQYLGIVNFSTKHIYTNKKGKEFFINFIQDEKVKK